MSNPLSTMPYGAFSALTQTSSFFDAFFGLYKHSYHLWCWTTLATSIVDKEAEENTKLIAAGATISFATSFFSTFNEPYANVARKIAIGYYALEAAEHMLRTWTSLNVVIEAFLEDQSSYVVPLMNVPEWSLYLVDEETGQWLLTSMHLTAIKIQRIGGALLIFTKDALLISFYIGRVQDAYNPTRFEEEKNKTLTLYHAKLLAQKISVYQDLTRKHSKDFEKLINTILGSTNETINFNKINDASKQLSQCLKSDHPIAKTAYNVFTNLFYCITDVRLSKYNTQQTPISSPKKEQNTPPPIDTKTYTKSCTKSDPQRANVARIRKNLLSEFDEVDKK